MKKPGFSYGRLFRTMFMLSAFTFGGGYVIVSMMRKKFVDALGWMQEQELLDLIAIGQSAPGPLAVNTSILVGYRLGGIRGFLCSVAGTVLPPLIILTLVSYAYDALRDNPLISAMFKTMQAGIAAIIADVVIDLGGKIVGQKNILSIVFMIGAFVAIYAFGVNVALVLLCCGAVGAARALLARRREGA